MLLQNSIVLMHYDFAISKRNLPIVLPRLGKEDITGVGHTAFIYRVQRHNSYME